MTQGGLADSRLASGPAGARAGMEALVSSKIRDVANAVADHDSVITLWYGEPDLPTPAFICDAAAAALAAGQTFYTDNRGIMPLREALSAYMSGLHARPVDVERISVTASGMTGLNLVQQILTDPGDNVVVVGPIWPNLIQTVRMMSGEPRIVMLDFGNRGWQLDLQKIVDRIDGRTRAIMVNSPSNPTGWVMPAAQQRALLEFARARGLWLIADEVYVRIVYDRPAAPSFVDLADPEDRVIVVNSFSKSWCMTGWRLGWLTAPASLGPTIEKLTEFHHSCSGHFSQIAGIAAVREGEPFIAETVERYRQARDLTMRRLGAMARVRIAEPEGAFYGFFAVEGLADSLALCKRIVTEAAVGLAPGSAFGREGEGFIRLCFASSLPRLETAMDRLERYFS